MPTPHKHAALIKQWADDPSQLVWYWHEHTRTWLTSNYQNMTANDNAHYAVGPRPTQPPRKMCVLAGVEFPMPETVAPPEDTVIFTPDLVIGSDELQFSKWEWEGIPSDERWLESGLIHLTREAAEQHSRALLAANKQAIEAAR